MNILGERVRYYELYPDLHASELSAAHVSH
jgi:hypothetical protein